MSGQTPGSFEEHPARSGLCRWRIRTKGRLVTLASGMSVAALDVKGASFPRGRSVYFLRNGLLVKIGWSDNVKARTRQIEASTGSKLELLATVPGGLDLERALHSSFRDLWHSGEWFHYTGRLADLIRRLPKVLA